MRPTQSTMDEEQREERLLRKESIQTEELAQSLPSGYVVYQESHQACAARGLGKLVCRSTCTGRRSRGGQLRAKMRPKSSESVLVLPFYPKKWWGVGNGCATNMK